MRINDIRRIRIMMITRITKMIRIMIMKVRLISTCDMSSVGSSVASSWRIDLLLIKLITGIAIITGTAGIRKIAGTAMIAGIIMIAGIRRMTWITGITGITGNTVIAGIAERLQRLQGLHENDTPDSLQ